MNQDERRYHAYSLYCRGRTIAEISTILGVERHVIKKDIESQKQSALAVLDRINREDYVATSMGHFDQVRKEIWANYESAEKPSSKAKFLELYLKLQKRESDFLADMGFLKMESASADVNINVATIMRTDVKLAALDGAAMKMLAAGMGMNEDELIAMQGSGRNVYKLAEPIDGHSAPDDFFDLDTSPQQEPVLEMNESQEEETGEE